MQSSQLAVFLESPAPAALVVDDFSLHHAFLLPLRTWGCQTSRTFISSKVALVSNPSDPVAPVSIDILCQVDQSLYVLL